MGRRNRASRPWPAIVVVVAALLAALVGTALAGPDATTSAINKKKVKKVATKQIKRLAPDLSVASAETAGSANTADSAANAAALGGSGPAAFQQRIRWALVDFDASIIRQTGGIRVTGHPNPGVYYLDFGTATSGKAILITNWYPNSDLDVTAQAAPCGTAPDADPCNANADPTGNPNDGRHVFVEISQANADEDHSFYIALVP